MEYKKFIVISGPTAVGKSQLGIDLAIRMQECGHPAAIINFDSLLFYRELNIGTCKPTLEERQGIEHFLIDVSSIKAPLNAAQFVRQASEVIKRLHDLKQIPILVGGSGFYLQALMEGMFETKEVSLEWKLKSDQLYASEGIFPFKAALDQVDPETAALLHLNDHYRIRRAVEHFWSTGRKFSEARSNLKERRQQEDLFEADHYYLDVPKDIHHHLIKERTTRLFQKNFEQEVRDLLSGKEFSGEERPLKSIGYKEMTAFIKGDIPSRNACHERIIISTRQLAKAQRTWFKKVSNKKCYDPLRERDKIIQEIIKEHTT